MAIYFKLPHPGGAAYDPAVNPAAKKWVPPKQPYVPPTYAAYPGGSLPEGYKTPGEEMREVIPELFDYVTPCPVGLAGHCEDHHSANLYRLIQHLNDEHHWSREEIADWLDSLEVDLTFKARGGDHADEQDSGKQG